MNKTFDTQNASPRASTIAAETPWYELFSRGARDWLRHNEKVRETVKGTLPDLLSVPDAFTRPGGRTVLVPIRLLEHARFRLRDPETQSGAGQGKGEPGDILRPARAQDDGGAGGGTERGEFKFVLELKIDDILDWFWDELKLPDLKPKHSASVDDPDLVREGWDKRGARSRLDRRRTVKEAVKRRAVQENPVPFANEDLRFRQLVRRRTPALNAVVMFALDVSGSMAEEQRKLAKTFFFFALHGLRRKYAKVEMVFVAHTVEAWEFQEAQFFQVTGDGGTQASSAFSLCADILGTRFDPARYNAYLFYASDGENASTDREAAAEALVKLAPDLNYAGYIETMGSGAGMSRTEMTALFNDLARRGFPAAAMPVSTQDEVWNAIRRFFTEQAEAAA